MNSLFFPRVFVEFASCFASGPMAPCLEDRPHQWQFHELLSAPLRLGRHAASHAARHGHVLFKWHPDGYSLHRIYIYMYIWVNILYQLVYIYIYKLYMSVIY